jgi:hypothetical protein
VNLAFYSTKALEHIINHLTVSFDAIPYTTVKPSIPICLFFSNFGPLVVQGKILQEKEYDVVVEASLP